MKVDKKTDVNLRNVRKLRTAVSVRDGRGGQVVIQAKRKTPGPQQTPNQRSWVDDFKTQSQISKHIGSCVFDQAVANAEAPPAGWTFWRDYLALAFAGKFIEFDGRGSNKRPKLFQNPENGVIRTTTPTARVEQTGLQNLTTGALVTLIPNVLKWDTNFFWNPLSLPGRLTVRVQGLYLIGAQIQLNVVNSQNAYAHLRVNNTTNIGIVTARPGSTGTTRQNLTTLWYFDPDDYIEIQAQSNDLTAQAAITNWWIVGISPETII